jgi:hypothetical protein
VPPFFDLCQYGNLGGAYGNPSIRIWKKETTEGSRTQEKKGRKAATQDTKEEAGE